MNRTASGWRASAAAFLRRQRRVIGPYFLPRAELKALPATAANHPHSSSLRYKTKLMGKTTNAPCRSQRCLN
ncbi:hypothetical protein CBM2605_B40081 [Cupriavidus neocaledonicus]|uniref:Uncharacterized protein n=1 Tax=Cupriavidus neocaledonicus TaxID=1040979 RepID=A0ABY1VAG1_9BURK|nr:hypothetical protein CBM2605_B40081 [Cupriavidus neocaledonicus]